MGIKQRWAGLWGLGQSTLETYDATFDPRYGRPGVYDPVRSSARSSLSLLVLFKILVSVVVLLPLTIIMVLVTGVTRSVRAVLTLRAAAGRSSRLNR